MLARIVGRLPVEYLKIPDKAIVKNIAREGMLKSITSINEFITMINNYLSARK